MPKNWTDGDTLTSAGLNEITQSINLRFASAAARDAALVGAIAPVPGMRCTTANDNVTWFYIVVNSVGYWAPQPGTLCFANSQVATQGNGGTSGILTGFTGSQSGGRNIGNWLNTATGVFNPKVPGIYEISAGASATDCGGSFYGYLRMNGSSSTRVPGSEITIPAPSGTQYCIPHPRAMVPLNGTTDYVEVYESLVGTLITAGWQASFAAKYMGWS